MPSWNRIVEENVAMVVNAAYRVLGNQADSEDVAQEVFLEAFRKWDESEEQNWPALLRRMTVFRSIDLLRRTRPNDPLPGTFADLKSTNPLENTMTRELQERLRVETGKLPDREAQVFCLVHFEKLQHSQVSEVLGISQSAVTTALSKARNRLQEIFLKTSYGDSKE